MQKHRSPYVEYQLLLNYHTNFDPADWQIYTNLHGFFLLLPNRYCSAVAADYDERAHGFRISSLTRVEHPEQAGSLYFASRLHPKPISEQLADFFIMDTDSYNWDIILSGHGGSTYYETMNDDGTLSWHAVPIIADLPLDQFHALLTFFNDESTRIRSIILAALAAVITACCHFNNRTIPIITLSSTHA